MADATNATNKKRTTRYTDDEMCKALTSFNGMVYLAAKHLGCAPSAIYRRMEKSARVREVVDNSAANC
jgi:transcriptional regulator of acetoin/glycerol metabolism